MRILLSFTHPHVSTNLYDFPLLMDLLKLQYDALFFVALFSCYLNSKAAFETICIVKS